MIYRVFLSNRLIKTMPRPFSQKEIREYCAVYNCIVYGIDMRITGIDYHFRKLKGQERISTPPTNNYT